MNATASTPAIADEQPPVLLRPLERGDLHFVHELNNNRTVMSDWFKAPYESFVELEELFRKHIHEGPAHPIGVSRCRIRRPEVRCAAKRQAGCLFERRAASGRRTRQRRGDPRLRIVGLPA